MPTRRDSSRLVTRPSFCNSRRMRLSMSSRRPTNVRLRLSPPLIHSPIFAHSRNFITEFGNFISLPAQKIHLQTKSVVSALHSLHTSAEAIDCPDRAPLGGTKIAAPRGPFSHGKGYSREGRDRRLRAGWLHRSHLCGPGHAA